jgi:gliding motility-associated-like protein
MFTFYKQSCKPIVFALFFLLPFVSFAQIGQNNFKYLNPTPTGITYLDVSFFNNNNGVAVGSNTGISRTTDGGQTWQYGAVLFTTSSGLKQRPTLNDVHFVTATIAYAVGDSGMMLKSVDAGANWTPINNPLYGPARNVNAVWFLNKDTGYIGGQAINLAPTSADSLNTACSPKLYFTKNGGSTWDSISAPRGALSWVGYIQNSVNPPIKVPVNALNKEIYRIQFLNDSIGYIIGSGSGTTSGFPQAYPGTTAGSTVTSTFAGNLGGLVWKFNKGVLQDYSITKEKLGYSGAGVFGTIANTTTYNVTTFPQQSLKAMTPINDSTLVLISFNNGCALRIKTGVNDFTDLSNFNPKNLPGALPAITGTLTPLPNAPGKYEILQLANAPTYAGTATPAAAALTVQLNQQPLPVLPPYSILNSNCVNAKRAPDGKLYFTTSGGKVMMSPDNGNTWSLIQAIPASFNSSGFQMFALDITANGKLHEMGTNGVHTISPDGVNWSPNYKTVAPNTAGQVDIDFADCNNGAVVGNPGLLYTTSDGGKTWVDKTVTSLAASLVSIPGIVYTNTNQMHLVASDGKVYLSTDQGSTINLLLNPIIAGQGYDIATFGTGPTTRIWATGHRFGPPLEKSIVYRSLNNGATWDSAKTFFPQGAAAANLQNIKFVDANTGYLCGTKGKVFKTTDGGATWLDISPPNAALSTGSQNALGVFGNTIYFWTLAFSANPNIRFLHKSTDGGATWSANLYPILVDNEPVFNVSAIMMHDANNVILTNGPSRIMITNDGGTTWRTDQAPSGTNFTGGVFVPKVVPTGTPMANRKAILCNSQIFEYGTNAINVTSSEVTTNGSCTNTTSGSVIVNAIGSVAPYSFSLSSVNGGAFQASNTFNNLAAGTYNLTIKTSACDSLVKPITIGFNNNLVLNKSNDTSVCAGAPVQLLASGNAASYSWSPATNLSATNIANPIATVNSNIIYTVTVALNTCSTTKQISTGVIPNPFVTAGPDFTIVDGDDVQLQGSGLNNVTNISWTPITTLTGANTFTPIAKPNTTTTYTLTVKDANSCTSTDAAVVTVIPYCVKIMEGFTPNGDGINDKWLVTTSAACANQVIANVYSRYGSLVYSNQNYNNTWDGTYKGKAVPDGTYYYKLTYRLINGKTVLQQGNVTIIR